MDFSLSDQILKYKKEAREWVENVLDPLSEPLEKEERFPVELVEALRKGRFFGLTIFTKRSSRFFSTAISTLVSLRTILFTGNWF